MNYLVEKTLLINVLMMLLVNEPSCVGENGPADQFISNVKQKNHGQQHNIQINKVPNVVIVV